jgi:hypothetical protein
MTNKITPEDQGKTTVVTKAATAVPAGGLVLFTVGASTRYRIRAFRGTYVSTATVGNRVPVFQVKDASGNVVWQSVIGNALTASFTAYYNSGGIATALDTGTIRNSSCGHIEGVMMEANWTFVVDDLADISATDTCALAMEVEEWIAS